METVDGNLARLLAACVLLGSFALLYQKRLGSLLRAFALQSSALALAAAWQGYLQGAPHLFVAAMLVFSVKAVAIPIALRRIVGRLGIPGTVDTASAIGPTLAGGVGLVVLSFALMLPTGIGTATREELAFSLPILLLGLLMMIARRDVIAQVVGFLSLENGLILAVVGALGMPLIVEMLVAFAVMAASVIFGSFVFRFRERLGMTDAGMEDGRGERR